MNLPTSEFFFQACLKADNDKNKIKFIEENNIETISLDRNTVSLKEKDIYNIELCYVKFPSNKDIVIRFNFQDNIYKMYIKNSSAINFDFNTKIFFLKQNLLDYLYDSKIPDNICSLQYQFLFFKNIIEKKYNNDEKYKKQLILDGINTFKEDKTFEFFITLFTYCYNNKYNNYVYKLLKEIPEIFIEQNKYNQKINMEPELEEIYKKRNEIISYLNKEKEKVKNNSKSNKDEIPKEFESKFYFVYIYYYLIAKNKDKVNSIMEDIKKEDKTILYELLKHYSKILKDFSIVNDDLILELISYFEKDKLLNIKKCLSYKKDVYSFLRIVRKKKEIIYESAKNENKFINISEYVIQNEKDNIKKIIEEIKGLSKFQKEKEYFFTEFNEIFWNNYLNIFNKCTTKNIEILNELWECFCFYRKRINEKSFKIKSIQQFYNKDEFCNRIHELIKQYIEYNKLSRLELMGYIFKKDPIYYNSEHEGHKKKRDISVLKKLNLKEVGEDQDFYRHFRDLKLDEVFEEQLEAYFDFIFKLKNNIDFLKDLLINFFEIQKIKSDKAKAIYIKKLKEKFNELEFDNEIPVEIEKDKVVNILTMLIHNLIDNDSNSDKFFKNIFEKKVGEKNYRELYLRILKQMEKEEKEQNMQYKQYKYFDKFFDYVSQYIITAKYVNKYFKLIKSEKNRMKLIEKFKVFNEEDFFSYDSKNTDYIQFYIDLDKDNNSTLKNSKYYKTIEKTLEDIKSKCEKFEISFGTMEQFLKIDKKKLNQG